MRQVAELAGGRTQSILPVWLTATILGALTLTAVDAVLLQQKKAFFTGGFLAAVHTSGPLEAAAFLLVSAACDAAAIGLAAALVLWMTARLRLTPGARFLAVFIAGVAPFLVTDFLTYRLASFLGDTFDLSLMFDLTGRKPQELLAVASKQLIVPALLLAAGSGAACALVWTANRLSAGAAERSRAGVRLLLVALAVFAAGSVLAAVARTANDAMDDGLGRKPSGRLTAWIVEQLTDVDRDGFGMMGNSRDPGPFDAAVFQYAVDVPGNGIDEDGIFGDLPSGTPPYEERGGTTTWRRQPNIVFIVLESFRADAVGRMVNGKPVTPVLDGLARRGVSLATAFSHNGYTAQSRFHLFSGGLAGLRDGTLIDDFKAHGYEVAYFSGQDDSFGGAAYGVGMERADVAYDARQDRKRRYSGFTTAGSLAVPFDVVQQRVGEFLQRRDQTRPLFLYINFHDTHYPYHRDNLREIVSGALIPESDIAPARGAALREMYFNTAANVDAAIGSTLEMVTRHLGTPPAVIATADHGESLFDEGFLGHGYALNDVQTRIPMIAAGLPLTLREPFGQADLRDAIGEALARATDEAPQVVAAGNKKVFQYLGRINRPRQIAFAAGASRTIYDFRTSRAQVGGGPWLPPAGLPADQAADVRELVRFWERMILARASTLKEDASEGQE